MENIFKFLRVALPVQAMDYTVVKAVCIELSTKWTPAKIERIVQADRFTLLISIRTVEQSGWLRFCWNPACAHVSVGDPSGDVLSIAEAFSFGEQLRYLLKGLAIIEVCLLDLYFWMPAPEWLFHSYRHFPLMRLICTAKFRHPSWIGDTLTRYYKFVTSVICDTLCNGGLYEIESLEDASTKPEKNLVRTILHGF